MKQFFMELGHYMKKHRRWWFLPMIAVFVLLGFLLSVGEFAPILTPFIYTLF